jgi:hypothetical protein
MTTPKIVIEKDVPLPASAKWSKYPFAEMEIGDSFVVPRERHEQLRSASSWAGRRHGRKFTIRIVGEQVRCWRIK